MGPNSLANTSILPSLLACRAPYSSALRLLTGVAGRKPDLALRLIGWSFDQVLNGLKHILDLLSLLFLLPTQLVQLTRQFFVGGEELPEPHKGAHDCYVHFHSAPTGEDARKHRNSLLREDVRPVAAAAAAFV